jgi:hypothetical protein
MTWYRCRATLGDGEYTSYHGTDISAALDSAERHPWAKVVTVEALVPEDTEVFGVRWKTVVSIEKGERHGLSRATRDVPAVVAAGRVADRVGDPQQDLGG